VIEAAADLSRATVTLADKAIRRLPAVEDDGRLVGIRGHEDRNFGLVCQAQQAVGENPSARQKSERDPTGSESRAIVLGPENRRSRHPSLR
jgi:hypothetical protein